MSLLRVSSCWSLHCWEKIIKDRTLFVLVKAIFVRQIPPCTTAVLSPLIIFSLFDYFYKSLLPGSLQQHLQNTTIQSISRCVCFACCMLWSAPKSKDKFWLYMYEYIYILTNIVMIFTKLSLNHFENTVIVLVPFSVWSMQIDSTFVLSFGQNKIKSNFGRILCAHCHTVVPCRYSCVDTMLSLITLIIMQRSEWIGHSLIWLWASTLKLKVTESSCFL